MIESKELQLVLYYENEKVFQEKLSLSTRSVVENPTLMEGWFPTNRMKLKEIGWKIIKALRYDPRRNLSEVAQELRVSSRTVKRRLTLMIEANAFFMVPQPNFRDSRTRL